MKFPPRYRVVAIDETANWDESIIAITGRIAGVYVINFAEVTHCASLTGSYWAEFVCNISENYVREPDWYEGGEARWSADVLDFDKEACERGKALAAIWKGTFYGIQHEGAAESSHYVDERFPEPTTELIDVVEDGFDEDPDDTSDPDEYRKQRDDAAMEGVQYLMSNGEDWTDIAPWKNK